MGVTIDLARVASRGATVFGIADEQALRLTAGAVGLRKTASMIRSGPVVADLRAVFESSIDSIRGALRAQPHPMGANHLYVSGLRDQVEAGLRAIGVRGSVSDAVPDVWKVATGEPAAQYAASLDDLAATVDDLADVGTVIHREHAAARLRAALPEGDGPILYMHAAGDVREAGVSHVHLRAIADRDEAVAAWHRSVLVDRGVAAPLGPTTSDVRTGRQVLLSRDEGARIQRDADLLVSGERTNYQKSFMRRPWTPDMIS